jgi:hypothetical protein
MKSKIALVVNTVSKNCDLWNMFFSQIDKHIPLNFFSNKYVFVDEPNKTIPDLYTTIIYDKKDVYRDQFLNSIKQVKEEFCLYISEDYILYNDILVDKLLSYQQFMELDNTIAFIRLHRGEVGYSDIIPYNLSNELFYVNRYLPYYYSQTATIWRTKDLEKIHETGPKLHIGNSDWQNSFEWNANTACLNLNKTGLFVYRFESKRGMYHYDSSVFPYIATALVKGRWNISEYKNELIPLINEYGIDITQRGEY